MEIELNDARQLASQDWLRPPHIDAPQLQIVKISLDDARDTASLLAEPSTAARSLYGLLPIPAGGSPVTNELVNQLRQELGI